MTTRAHNLLLFLPNFLWISFKCVVFCPLFHTGWSTLNLPKLNYSCKCNFILQRQTEQSVYRFSLSCNKNNKIKLIVWALFRRIFDLWKEWKHPKITLFKPETLWFFKKWPRQYKNRNIYFYFCSWVIVDWLVSFTVFHSC